MANGIRKVNEFIIRDGRAITFTTASVANNDKEWDSIADGTLRIDPQNGDLRYKKRGSTINNWDKFEASSLLGPKSVTADLIADRAIEERSLKDGSISTRSIINGAVTGDKIAAGAINNIHITDNTLEARALKDDTLNGSKLIDSTVHGNKIINATVVGGKMVAATITSRELGNSCVTSDKLHDGSVTSAKFADNAVTTGKISNGSVTTTKLEDGSVTELKIANTSVTGAKIANNTIRESNLMSSIVTTTKIADGAVTNSKLADGTIHGTKIANATITGDKLVNNTITRDKLEATLQASISDTVVHTATPGATNNKVATVYGDLRVNGNIKSDDAANLTRTIQGFKVFNPVFADFAEGFIPGEELHEGEVVEIGDDGKVYKAGYRSNKAIGIVSNRFGICLDAGSDEIESGEKVAIGLVGKVPVNVTGQIEAGDLLISAGDGVAMAKQASQEGNVIAIALENKKTIDTDKILCLIKSF